MPYEKIKNYFSSFFFDIAKGDGTKVYPMSMQSSSVRDVLYNEALSLGVKFEFEQEVLSTIKRKNIFEVNTTIQSYKSTYLIVSTGSTAMKKLGSCDSGYSFAKSFGHKIIPTYPSLVQLKSDDKSIYNLSGVKIKSNIQLYINNKFIQKEYADILFTKYGVSGNGILTLSRASSKAILDKQKVYLMVDILPNISKNDIYELLITRKQLLKNKKINFLLESIINTKMINFIYNKANIKVDTIYKLTTKDIDNIVYILKNIKIPISSTNGEQNAEICAGGVDVEEVNDKTMMSKKISNLYFCGEVLDVDGSCGGYNFHWAWSSASVCANSFK
jgi:predicted Rossmann fold flavoprotein